MTWCWRHLDVQLLGGACTNCAPLLEPLEAARMNSECAACALRELQESTPAIQFEQVLSVRWIVSSVCEATALVCNFPSSTCALLTGLYCWRGFAGQPICCCRWLLLLLRPDTLLPCMLVGTLAALGRRHSDSTAACQESKALGSRTPACLEHRCAFGECNDAPCQDSPAGRHRRRRLDVGSCEAN